MLTARQVAGQLLLGQTCASFVVPLAHTTLSALKLFLEGQAPVFFFNNNQVNSGDSTNQYLASWGQAYGTDPNNAIIGIFDLTGPAPQDAHALIAAPEAMRTASSDAVFFWCPEPAGRPCADASQPRTISQPAALGS